MACSHRIDQGDLYRTGNKVIEWGDNLHYWTLEEFQTYTEYGSHSISKYPAWVDHHRGNFHLRIDSPCIDAGTEVGLPYTGSAPYLGALEFVPYLARDQYSQPPVVPWQR